MYNEFNFDMIFFASQKYPQKSISHNTTKNKKKYIQNKNFFVGFLIEFFGV